MVEFQCGRFPDIEPFADFVDQGRAEIKHVPLARLAPNGRAVMHFTGIDSDDIAGAGLDLSAAGGLALALLASGALLWTVLLRRRRRYADIGV